MTITIAVFLMTEEKKYNALQKVRLKEAYPSHD